MRIRELLESTNDQLAVQVLGVVNFLRQRSHDKQSLPGTTTTAFINMVNNVAGMPGMVDFDNLQALVDKNDALKDLVSKFDRNTIEFKPFGDEPGAPQEEPEGDAGAGKAKDPTSIVNKMADRAMNKRS